MARNALGRGLSALIREPGLVNQPAEDVATKTSAAPAAGTPAVAVTTSSVSAGAAAATAPALAPGSEIIVQIDIDLIDPSPHQPRTRFDQTAMDELAASIQASGIIQPVLARRKGARYELIAGERRWRAAQAASMQRIPAILRNVSDEKAVEMTLIENLQREDLNPLEEAMAFDRLFHDFGMTHDDIAARTGKSRSAISNSTRLLRLEPQVQKMIAAGEISASHARALVTITDPVMQLEAAKRAARGRISVRQIERMTHKNNKPPKPGSVSIHDPNVKHMLGLMEQKYGTKVTLKPFVGGKGGHLIFHYYENEYLGTLYDLLMIEH
jgi:ParB family transcriptional regulator, chromosome partitioning protein